ncbi:MAG: hypothetical protein D8H99_54205 [Streptococcus sp.]|nr:MAG: hypothetical protein D8H99_54205 [Streptococcus sp.]
MVEFRSPTVDGVYLRLKMDIVETSVRRLTTTVKVMVFAHSELNDPIKIDRKDFKIEYITSTGFNSIFSGTTYSDYIQGKDFVLVYDGRYVVSHSVHDGEPYGKVKAQCTFTTPKPGGTRTNTLTGEMTVPKLDMSISAEAPWFLMGRRSSFNMPSLAGTNKTYAVNYHFGNKIGQVGSNFKETITWDVPLELAEQIPESISGTGTLTIDTYDIVNGVKNRIAQKSVTFTAEIPDYLKPETGQIVLEDLNDIAKALLPANTFVSGVSEIKVTCPNIKLKYGATLKDFTASIARTSWSTNENGGSLPIISLQEYGAVEVTITDSRGMKSFPTTIGFRALRYQKPAFTFIAYRTKQDARKIQVSRYMKIAPLMFNGKQLNRAVLKFKSALMGTTNFVEAPGPANGEWNTIFEMTNSAANLAPDFEVSKSYQIRAELSDIFTENDPTVSSYTVGPELVIHAYDDNGRFGAGKIPDNGPFGSVDIQGRFYSQGNLIQHKQITQHDGTAFKRTDNKEVWDFDALNDTGVYHMRQADKHNPLHNDGILECWKMDSGTNQAPIMCFQRFTSFAGGVATRYSYGPEKNAKGWGEWTYDIRSKQLKEINDDAKNGWKTADSSNYHYKVRGDVVYFRYTFRGTGGNMVLYTFPPDVYVAPEQMMLVCTAWSTETGSDTHFQINSGTGTIHALNTQKGARYSGMITLIK